MPGRRGTRKQSTPQGEAPHPLEWLIGGISGLLIVALIGYLGYRAIATDGRPPRFIATVETVESIDELFHVRVAVTNTGDETAADLIVRAALGRNDPASETGEIRLDYVPAGSTRRGTFVFRSDPARAGGLRFFFLGYTEP